MKICELIYETECALTSESANIEVENIEYRMDRVKKGDLFFFIKGHNYDTKKLLAYAVSREPCAIVTEEWIENCQIPQIIVKSTRQALSFAYARKEGVDFKKLHFIGVTGTNGKTTTATMIYKILRNANKGVGFIGTGKILINNLCLCDNFYSMTTPDPHILYPTLRKMQENGCEYVVMEVSSHALALKKVSPITFDVGVYTNLSYEHMDFHKNMDNYTLAKKELFYNSKVGIFNIDDSYAEKIIKGTLCEKITVGAIYDCDINARRIENRNLKGLSYLYSSKNVNMLINLKLCGIYNVYNSLLAITTALHIGIDPAIIKRTLFDIESIEGRMEKVNEAPLVYIDYAHTERALENVLKMIKSNNTLGQKIILIFGCGGERDKTKRPKMAAVAEKYADFCIITEDNSRAESTCAIFKDILSGFSKEANRRVISNRKCAIEYALEIAKENDVILIVGKGHEKYIIDKNEYRNFDEKSIIKEALMRKREAVFK